MGNLSNGDHGQGKYCLSSLLRINVNCYKAFQFALNMFYVELNYYSLFLLKHVH